MKKKDILFYTFLCIFILTAAITILGVIEVISIKSGYLNTLFTILVVELISAVIALFKKANFFVDDEIKFEQRDRVVVQTEMSPSSELQSINPERSEISAVEYFKQYHGLDTRFHEQEEFAMKLNGRLVDWRGFVNSVGSYGDYISIQLRVSEEAGSDLIHADVSNKLKTKAFALQKGDPIAISGVLKTSFMPHAPSVKNASFRLEKKESSSLQQNSANQAL